VEENWQMPGNQNSDDSDIDTLNPKKLRRTNSFNINVDFEQYRRGRRYTIKLEATEYFHSFLLQARGDPRPDGNATLVGSFVKIPPISRHLKCFKWRRSSVIDKGRPVKLANMTFTWQAPPMDYGRIRFVASIVTRDGYATIQTQQIPFNPFPVSIKGCGREKSCFRACSTTPTCPPDDSSYMVVTELSEDSEEVIISMGGIVDADQTSTDVANGEHEHDKHEHKHKGMEKYVAIGFGYNKQTLQGMDVCACYKEGDEIRLGHYLVENARTNPYMHRSELVLDKSDIDRRNQFIWCQFRRPIHPDSNWDLDLSRNMFHFYFIGNQNNSVIYLPTNIKEDMWDSGFKRNFSEIINEIHFTGSVDSASINITLLLFSLCFIITS